jgi:hypothetical protein
MSEQRDDDDDDIAEWDDDPDDESGYIPCPHCGETMLEAADHCPACDRWITSEDVPRKRQPVWVVAVILILLATIILSVLPI